MFAHRISNASLAEVDSSSSAVHVLCAYFRLLSCGSNIRAPARIHRSPLFEVRPMLPRTAALAVSTALFLAACAPTDNSVAPVNSKLAPASSNLTVSNEAVFEMAPIEYAEPILNQADQEGGGIFVRDAFGGIPGKPNPNILYLGGALITQQKLVAVYVGGATIYPGGPALGTKGAGTADGSLVGHVLRNIGGTSYWNINSTYHQDQGSNAGFVQNSMGYTGFWAPQFTNPPKA